MAAGDIRAGGAVVEITGDEKGLRAALQRAAAKLESFEGQIKGIFGPRSLLKDAAEIALGGGAVAGVTFAAQAVGDAAKKIAELNAQFNDGQLSAAEYTGEIARSIPVLGQMVTMFDEIGAAITGQGAELAKLTEENKRAAEAWAAFDKAVAGAKQRLTELNPNKGVESLEAIDAAIAAQRNKYGAIDGGQNRLKELQRLRGQVAARELEQSSRGMTIENIQANERRQKEVDAGRLNRNQILDELGREQAKRVKQQQSAILEELTAASIEQIAGFDGAAEVERQRGLRAADLQRQLKGINGELQRNSSGSTNLNPALIDPSGRGESQVVQELKNSREEIIRALEDLVAD